MSPVFQVVPMIAPGVPGVPKPDLPDFQEESLKSGSTHSAAGFCVVYRHGAGSLSAAGRIVTIRAGTGSGLHLAILVLSRGRISSTSPGSASAARATRAAGFWLSAAA